MLNTAIVTVSITNRTNPNVPPLVGSSTITVSDASLSIMAWAGVHAFVGVSTGNVYVGQLIGPVRKIAPNGIITTITGKVRNPGFSTRSLK